MSKRFSGLVAAVVLASVAAVAARQSPAGGPPPDQPASPSRSRSTTSRSMPRSFDRQGQFVPDLKREDFEISRTASGRTSGVHAGEHPNRAARAAAAAGHDGHRARRGDATPVRSTGASTSSSSTTSTPLRCAARWSRRRPRSSSHSYMASQRHRRRRHHRRAAAGDAGVHQQQARCCCARSTTSWARRSSPRPRSASTNTSVSRPCPSGPSNNTSADRRSARHGARLRRAHGARDAREVSDWVGSIRGRRKAIVLFSEGIDYDIYDFQQARGVDGRREDEGRHRVGDALRREHLLDRSARAHVARRRVDRGVGRVPGRSDSGSHACSRSRTRCAGAGQPAHAVRGDRRLRRGEQQRLHQRLHARRQGQQRATTCSGYYPKNERRDGAVPPHRGEGEEARPRSPRAARLHGAARQGAREAEGAGRRSDVAGGARGARQPGAACPA